MTLGLRPFSGFFFSIPPLSIYIFLIIRNNAFHPTPSQFAMGLASLSVGLLLLHFYRYTFATIAFKAKEITNIMKMLDLFGDFGAYPYEMYHQPLLTVVMFVAPLLPAAGIPASYFLGKSTTITPLLIQLALLTFFIIACSIGWKKGLKAYESASS
jgi:ABC-2 type transport system permease protein